MSSMEIIKNQKLIKRKWINFGAIMVALFIAGTFLSIVWYNESLKNTTQRQSYIQNHSIPVKKSRVLGQSTHHSSKLYPIEKIIWLYEFISSEQQNHSEQQKSKKNLSNRLHQPSSSFLSNKELETFEKMNLLNTKKMAEIGNYTVREVGANNYKQYLSEEGISTIERIKQILSMLQDSNKVNKAVQQHLGQSLQTANHIPTNPIHQQIIKRLIIYSLIKQHGGVHISNRGTLIEPMDQWIQIVPSNPFINPPANIFGEKNQSNTNQNPYCLGFYNDSFSSSKANFGKQNVDGQKFAVLYPNVQDYFLACGKGNKFLEKLVGVYVKVLMEGSQWEGFQQFDTNESLIGMTDVKSIYEHGHIIASHYVLQIQYKALTMSEQQQSLYISTHSEPPIPTNTLSLYTINSRLGPHKLLNQFSAQNYKTYTYLSKLTLEELEIFVGPLRFMFVLNDQVIRVALVKLYRHESDSVFVEKGSFVHLFLVSRLVGHFTQKQFRNSYKEKNETQLKNMYEIIKTYRIIKNSPNSKNQAAQPPKETFFRHTQIQIPQVKEIIFDETKPTWQSLQKIIWVIWDNGIEGKSNFMVQLCYQNLKKSAQNSQFQIRAVSKKQIDSYISPEILSKINNATKHAAFALSNQAISDLWRMALIYEHGGVYLDASTFMMDFSFDWITKVTQMPEHLIWNRYGQQPDVFMFWNAYYCNAVDWHIDRKHKTRAQWQLSLQNNFIAASKRSEFIREWLDTMLQWITLPQSEVQKQMKSVGMFENRWTNDNFWQEGRYLTAMDTIKYVLGKRQQMIKSQKYIKMEETSGEYYKLWSMPGQFIGQQKLRGETNYENRDYRLEKKQYQIDNIYKYQYPLQQIEKVLGPIQFQGKFFNWELIMMNKMVIDFYQENRNNFTIEKLKQIVHEESVIGKKLLYSNPEKTLELLEHYSQLSRMKLKMKGFNSVWSY